MIGSTSVNIAHFGQACLSLLQKIAKPDFEQERGKPQPQKAIVSA
jgi:hypothetical protein